MYFLMSVLKSRGQYNKRMVTINKPQIVTIIKNNNKDCHIEICSYTSAHIKTIVGSLKFRCDVSTPGTRD